MAYRKGSRRLMYTPPMPRTREGEILLACEQYINVENSNAHERAVRAWEDAGEVGPEPVRTTPVSTQLWWTEMDAMDERAALSRFARENPTVYNAVVARCRR